MLSTLFQAAVPLVGAFIGSSGNRSAANTAANAQLAGVQAQIEASREARREFREGADRGIAAIRAGTGRYTETIAPLMTPNPVMLPTHRGLTANQQIGRQDLLRQGQATLAASGLRGAGRAGVGTILDADRRFIASAAEGNDRETRGEMRRAQSVADNARAGLAQVQAQEGGAIASTEVGVGNQMGASLAADGRATAAGTAQAGNYQAGATTANAQLWGDAIGGLGSVIANATRPGGGTKNLYTSTGSPI
jgi:hypothetical protein